MSLICSVIDAASPILAGRKNPPRLDVQPLEEAVKDRTYKGRDGERPEGGRSTVGIHQESSKKTSRSFADAKEESSHEPHHTGERVWRRNLGNVGDC